MKIGAKGLVAVFAVIGVVGCSAAAEVGEDQDVTDDQELAVKSYGFCGGFANLPCPDGLECVDDPHDGCDPSQGGADCGGICVKPKKDKKAQCGSDPTKTYVSNDPNECMLIKFACAEGVPFFDDCGCGCQVDAGTPCGANTCVAGEYCCNESCGICAPMGSVCIQQVCY